MLVSLLEVELNMIQLCRIHLQSANIASVLPYCFFLLQIDIIIHLKKDFKRLLPSKLLLLVKKKLRNYLP